MSKINEHIYGYEGKHDDRVNVDAKKEGTKRGVRKK